MRCKKLLIGMGIILAIGMITGGIAWGIIALQERAQQTNSICDHHPDCCSIAHIAAGVEFYTSAQGTKVINRNDFTVSVERRFRFSGEGSESTLNVNELNHGHLVSYRWARSGSAEQFIIYRQSGAPIGVIRLDNRGIDNLRSQCREQYLHELE